MKYVLKPLLGAVAVCVAAVAAYQYQALQGGITPPNIHEPPSNRGPISRIEDDINWADKQTRKAIGRSLESIDRFFEQAKQNTPEFADELLSFRTKLEYIFSTIFSTKEEFQKYIQKLFAQKVFSPDDLKKTVESALISFAKECDNIDNQLFVKIKADVPSLHYRLPRADRFVKQINHQTLDTLRELDEEVWKSIKGDIASFAVGWVIEEIVTIIISQVSQRIGFLVAGTAVSWETFGISILVGIVVDWILEWWTDPQGKLTQKLNQELDKMHQELRKEVKRILTQMANARHQARSRVIREALGN